MWNVPTEQELSPIPGLYQTEHVRAEDKLIHMHFFIGGCDWYVAEYDGEDQFFGYAVLNGDLCNAEWGYFSLSELRCININGFEIDRDLYWQPVPFGEIFNLGGNYGR